jgi:hypothetical protein
MNLYYSLALSFGTSFETAYFLLDVDAVGAVVGPTRGAGTTVLLLRSLS